MFKFRWVLMILLTVPCFGAGETVEDLENLKEWYVNNIKPFEITKKSSLRDLKEKYLHTLKQKRDSYIIEGNLDGILSIDRELSALKGKNYKSPVTFNYLEQVKKLNRIYSKESSKILREYQLELENHNHQFLLELRSLESSYTRLNQIKTAVIIRKEINKFVKEHLSK